MVERKTSVYDYDPPMVMARVVPGDEDMMQVVQATALDPTGLSPQPTAPLTLSPQPTAPVASITASASAPYAPNQIEISPRPTAPVAPIAPLSEPYAVDHQQQQQVNGDRTSFLGASSDDGTTHTITASSAGNNGENQCEQQVGACVAGGILGLLLGGPLGAILVGYGTVYYVDKDGAVGDISRAMGEIAISVRDKAGELNKKHNIVENSKIAAENAWEKAKQADREHHIVEQTKQVISMGFRFIGNMTQLLLIKISQKVQEEQQQRHQSEAQNETRNFLEKSKIAAEETWEKIKQADREHHIVEITKQGLTIGLQFVVGAAKFLFITISQKFEEDRQRRETASTTRQ